MFSAEVKVLFLDLLFNWYSANKRTLPWRGNRDPYIIWVTEVVFQQTRIDQGIDHFINFIKLFPNIQTLASSLEDDVLKAWQGLGYYSRARNLRKSAQMIMTDYGGEFPRAFDEIKKLKGIGDYSASAIASICFGAPHAAVDGNVQRVISRLFAISDDMGLSKTQKRIKEVAQGILSEERPGDFNESLMELGALICHPTVPKCGDCPVSELCEAFQKGKPTEYPVRKRRLVRRRRILHYLLVMLGSGFYLQRREQMDIWHGLYELPMVEGEWSVSDLNQKFCQLTGCQDLNIEFLEKSHHLLTHQDLQLNFYRCFVTTGEMYSIDPTLIHVTPIDYSRYALPKPLVSFLEKWVKDSA